MKIDHFELNCLKLAPKFDFEFKSEFILLMMKVKRDKSKGRLKMSFDHGIKMKDTLKSYMNVNHRAGYHLNRY